MAKSPKRKVPAPVLIGDMDGDGWTAEVSIVSFKYGPPEIRWTIDYGKYVTRLDIRGDEVEELTALLEKARKVLNEPSRANPEAGVG